MVFLYIIKHIKEGVGMVKKSRPALSIPTSFGPRLSHEGLEKGLGKKVMVKPKPFIF